MLEDPVVTTICGGIYSITLFKFCLLSSLEYRISVSHEFAYTGMDVCKCIQLTSFSNNKCHFVHSILLWVWYIQKGQVFCYGRCSLSVLYYWSTILISR